MQFPTGVSVTYLKDALYVAGAVPPKPDTVIIGTPTIAGHGVPRTGRTAFDAKLFAGKEIIPISFASLATPE